MPQMHLKQLGFSYSACGPFTKKKEIIQKFKETGDTKYIYRNELNKACFQHNIAYGDFKDLAIITASDKVLIILLKIQDMMDIKKELLLWFRRFFDKKPISLVDTSTAVSGVNTPQNKQLAEELHKPIIRNFKKKNSLF